jgi:hypothetical protein
MRDVPNIRIIDVSNTRTTPRGVNRPRETLRVNQRGLITLCSNMGRGMLKPAMIYPMVIAATS